MSRGTRALHLAADALGFRLADGRTLFRGLSFGLSDERVGVVGPNGAGKSTFLRVLAGELPPGDGVVRRLSPVAYVPQGAAPDPHATVGEVLGLPPDAAVFGATARTLAALGLAHLPLDRPVSAVSGGEATRLALASRVIRGPRALLLDEPTNDLDAAGRAIVHALVAGWPHGLVVATHDRALLAHVDRIVELCGPTARTYGGNYDAYRAQVELERAAAARERASAEAAVRRVERELRSVRERKARSDARGKRARGTGSQPKLVLNARRERSQGTGARLRGTAERLAESARGRAAEAKARVEERDALRIAVPATGLARGTTVIAMQGAVVGPPAAVAGTPPVLRDVTLEVVGPERVAITGPNGAGKSSLLHVIAGLGEAWAGNVRRGVPTSRVAFLDQHALLLRGGRTVFDAFAALHPALDRNAVHEALARFHFRADAARQATATLSGGERMRAALACVLAGPEPPQCLVLDEPTNHLDVASVEQLEGALRAYDGAVVVASHDAAFLEAIGVERRVEVRLLTGAG
jgi:ATPase subunit of ABC transporter with duplicated ATPase domains